jgi:flagellin
MAGTVNTNIGATRAAAALTKNERDMNTAMQRLSTGKRINSAQDDAAGLAIASKMTSQINSLDQAVRNAQDAISMVMTIDGAMVEITNMVQRMRQLAIQAISDTNTNSDRAALNLEFQALSQEVSRIGGNTQWNGGNVLDGTVGTNGVSTFHIGANANQTIQVGFPTIGSTEGDFILDKKVDGAYANSTSKDAIVSESLTVTESTAGVTAVTAATGVYVATLGDSAAGALADGFAMSDGTKSIAIADMSGVTNIASLVTAITGATGYGDLGFTVAAGNGGLTLTYKAAGAVSAAPTGTSLTLNETTKGVTAVAGVNAVYAVNITDAKAASLSSPFVITDGTNSVTLKDMSGVTNIATLAAAIEAATATPNALQFTTTATASGLTLTWDSAKTVTSPPTATVSEAQVSTLDLSTIFGTIRDGDTITYTIDGKAASAVLSAVQNADNSWSMTGIKSSDNTTGLTAGLVTIGTVLGADGNPRSDQLILTGTNGTAFSVENIQVTRGIGANVGNTDIMTFTTATAALNVLDDAVASVNLKRADLGATTSRLNYAADNMSSVSMNARQSRSRVEDADYARETTELARTQIIQQAGTAMLAQANQSAQAVLKLLNT